METIVPERRLPRPEVIACEINVLPAERRGMHQRHLVNSVTSVPQDL
jgi:hypothetical protein